MLGEDRVRIGPVTVAPDAPRLDPGVVAAGKRDVFVGTVTDSVRLSTVQAPGKRAMAAADWARGTRPEGSVQFS
jgi:methionyl-tRNA formyltransferase